MEQISRKQMVLNTTTDVMTQWTRVVITTVCVCALIMSLLLNIFVLRRHDVAVERVTYSKVQLIKKQKINELLEIVCQMHRLVFSNNFIGTENASEDSVTKNIASQSVNFTVDEESVIENQSRDNVEKLAEIVDLNKLLVGHDRKYLLNQHQNNQDQVSKLSKLKHDDSRVSNIKNSSSDLTIQLQAANSFTSKTMHNPNGFYRRDISFAKSNCNSSLRSKLMQNRFFHERYINDIPILIYNAMFSPREYYQRNEYPPPYGWKNITYKDISETVEMLHSSVHRHLFAQQSADKCRRCAVVGKLRSLLSNTQFGFKIDSFENVFRSNLVATSGFEKYTGTRTTHYFYTFSSLVDATEITDRLDLSFTDIIPTNKDVKFISSDSDEASYKYLHWMLTNHIFGNTSTHHRKRWPLLPTNKPESFRIVHPDLLRYTSDRWINITNSNSGKLDLELTMLLVALHTCDEIAVFGLGTLDNRKNKQSQSLQQNQDLSKTELLVQLHNNNIIKLYG